MCVLLKSQRIIHTGVKDNTCLSSALTVRKRNRSCRPGHIPPLAAVSGRPHDPFHGFPRVACKPRPLHQPWTPAASLLLLMPSTFPVHEGQGRSHSRLSPVSTWPSNQKRPSCFTVWFYLIIWVALEEGMFVCLFVCWSLVAIIQVALYSLSNNLNQMLETMNIRHQLPGHNWAFKWKVKPSYSLFLVSHSVKTIHLLLYQRLSGIFFSLQTQTLLKRSNAGFLDTRSVICKQTLASHIIF